MQSSFDRIFNNAILKGTFVSMGAAVSAWLSVVFGEIKYGNSNGMNNLAGAVPMVLFVSFVATFAILLPAMVFFAAIETRRRSRWVNVIAALCMAPVALFGVGLLRALVMVLFLLLVGPIFGGPLRLEELYHLPTILAEDREIFLACVCLTVPLCLAIFARLERFVLRRQILMVVALTPVITGVFSIPSALTEHTPIHSGIRVKEGVSLEEAQVLEGIASGELSTTRARSELEVARAQATQHGLEHRLAAPKLLLRQRQADQRAAVDAFRAALEEARRQPQPTSHSELPRYEKTWALVRDLQNEWRDADAVVHAVRDEVALLEIAHKQATAQVAAARREVALVEIAHKRATAQIATARRKAALVEADYKQALQRALMLIAVCCLLAVMLPVAFCIAEWIQARIDRRPAIADPAAG